jgi:CDP-4-dehydro-6-deoxyglucose reductase
MSKKIILAPSGKELSYDEGETVLSALERQGYAIPNNCRAGACGECKVKVVKGDYDQGFILDMALSPEDREDGFGLMCMAKITSDQLEIEWATEDNALPKLFPPEENRTHILLNKEMVTPNIVKLVLRTMTTPMRFWPGQYITLGDQQRPYSIANTPNSNGDIVLFITKVNEGRVSSWAHDELKEGDYVSLNGPYGTFIGDPSAKTPVLCLASGSGLAPILSLATAAMNRGFKMPAKILFSARTKEDLFAIGQMSYLKAKYRYFDFDYTLTGEANPGGKEGRITSILKDEYSDLSGHSIYIAGNPDFVKDCEEEVKRLGAKDDFIHTEGFFASQN